MIYVRVSSDRAEGRSVAEQERDCRSVCESNGWNVRRVVTDNDLSASRYRTSERPGYLELQQILRPGDVLVTWESSRGYRDLEDYLTIRNLCASRDVLLSYSGRTYDLTEGDDRFTTGLDALIAEKYAEETRKRILRAHQANLQAGKPHGRIPYGYQAVRDPHTGKIVDRVPDPAEAPIIREAYRRVLDGESLGSICRDFNARGITPLRRREWEVNLLKPLLLRPSNAGLRSHKGEVVTEGTWEGIVSREDWERVSAVLSDPERTARAYRGMEPRYLLSGIATCSECGDRLWHNHTKHPPRKDGTRHTSYYYRCKKGHVARNTAKLDAMIERVMILLLEDPRVIARLEKTDDDAAIDAMEHARALRAHMDEKIAAIIAQDLPAAVTASALRNLSDHLQPQIDAAEKQSMLSATNPLLHKLCGPNAQQRWNALTIEEKRAAVRSALTIEVMKPKKGSRVFDPNTVKVEWRV